MKTIKSYYDKKSTKKNNRKYYSVNEGYNTTDYDFVLGDDYKPAADYAVLNNKDVAIVLHDALFRKDPEYSVADVVEMIQQYDVKYGKDFLLTTSFILSRDDELFQDVAIGPFKDVSRIMIATMNDIGPDLVLYFNFAVAEEIFGFIEELYNITPVGIGNSFDVMESLNVLHNSFDTNTVLYVAGGKYMKLRKFNESFTGNRMRKKTANRNKSADAKLYEALYDDDDIIDVPQQDIEDYESKLAECLDRYSSCALIFSNADGKFRTIDDIERALNIEVDGGMFWGEDFEIFPYDPTTDRITDFEAFLDCDTDTLCLKPIFYVLMCEIDDVIPECLMAITRNKFKPLREIEDNEYRNIPTYINNRTGEIYGEATYLDYNVKATIGAWDAYMRENFGISGIFYLTPRLSGWKKAYQKYLRNAAKVDADDAVIVEESVAARFARYRRMFESADEKGAEDAFTEDEEPKDEEPKDEEPGEDKDSDNAEEEQDVPMTAVLLTVAAEDADKCKDEMIEAGIAEDDIEILDAEEGEDNVKIKIDVNSVFELKDYLKNKGIDLEEKIGGEIIDDDAEDEVSDEDADKKDDDKEGEDSFDDIDFGDIFGDDDDSADEPEK